MANAIPLTTAKRYGCREVRNKKISEQSIATAREKDKEATQKKRIFLSAWRCATLTATTLSF
jgi:hypothetical protein